jgi:hypothetical protein
MAAATSLVDETSANQKIWFLKMPRRPAARASGSATSSGSGWGG